MNKLVEWLRLYADHRAVIDVSRLNEAADEIERLREEAEFNYMAGYDAAKDDYRDMLQEREDEIEKLRAALENIIIHCDWPDRVEKYARAALEVK